LPAIDQGVLRGIGGVPGMALPRREDYMGEVSAPAWAKHQVEVRCQPVAGHGRIALKRALLAWMQEHFVVVGRLKAEFAGQQEQEPTVSG